MTRTINQQNAVEQQIDFRFLKRSAECTGWDKGNRVLYDLCRKYPWHTDEEEICAKMWLIGRSYAAAIERRPKSDYVGGRFYQDVVGPKIRNSKIDKWLASIARYRKPSWENCSDIIAVHKKLTDLLYKISGVEKRSLASKICTSICQDSSIFMTHRHRMA